MLLLLIYVKSLLQNTVFFIFLLKTFGAYYFLLYLCTRFKEMPPCGFFLADLFFEKFYIYREVVQEASASSLMLADG
ncbi:hypothetical protein CTM45_07390 [Prevotella intermedia]|uniref:Uncharacterized protein n=1 Tax=Prevotella intermedia TaxID=28131 RepID=A0A2D3LJC0_PREIN|nr:hypothetical protein CTM46_03695 [Prevotella intermedia]PJI23116.1 hypothetical protein CTM45_07390 [Prevotella intermedia]